MQRPLRVLLLTISFALIAPGAAIFDVTMDTSLLIGDPAGPFSLLFQLTDGSGTGDANNTVTISNLTGATPVGGPTAMGGVAGDLSSALMLTDSSFLTLFSQQFTPGAMMGFRLSFTTEVDAGPTPDQFSMSILDSSGTPLPTMSLASLGIDVFLSLDLDSASATPQAFAGNQFSAPFLAVPAPTLQEPIPEPATLVGMAAGLGLLIGLRLRQRGRIPH